jgi:hypothetical protein
MDMKKVQLGHCQIKNLAALRLLHAIEETL